MTTPSLTANNIFGIGALSIVLLFFAYQSFIFLKDVRFYRRVKWDLTLDSGNRMLFLETVRQSVSSRKQPVGYLRLRMGYQQFAIGLLLLALFLFYRLFWFLRGPQGVSEVTALDERTSTFIGVGFLLGFILLNWIGTFWLDTKIGEDLSRPDIFDKYIGNRLSAKSLMILRNVVAAVFCLAYGIFLTFLISRQL